MKSIEIDNFDAVVIISPDNVALHFPDELATELDEDTFELDTGNDEQVHILLAWSIFSLLTHDEEFPEYVLRRASKVMEDKLPAEYKLESDDED